MSPETIDNIFLIALDALEIVLVVGASTLGLGILIAILDKLVNKPSTEEVEVSNS